MQYLESNGSFSILLSLVERSPQIQALFTGNTSANSSGSGGQLGGNSSSQYTVWAPTDNAFGQILQGNQDLAQNFSKPKANEFLDFILAYHITNGTFNVTQQVPAGSYELAPTALGFVSLNVSDTNNTYWVNDAKIHDPQGVICSDGDVYAINGIVSPLYFLGISLQDIQVSNSSSSGGGSSGGTQSRRRIRLA